MGDRSNVVILHGKDLGVGIYTHWNGSKLPKMVKLALKNAKPRWDDDIYFTRMIFDSLLTQVCAHNTELGWGLYPYTGTVLCEEEHETVFINIANQTVQIGESIRSFEDYLE